MKKREYKIHIIGAGVSGLVSAKVLEDNGFSPVIIEATSRVGGRVKTDLVDGYQLDHGFQVLLTAYPAAQKYLNFQTLELQLFLPGAAIFKNGKQQVIGDPLRAISLLVPTLFSNVGTIADKIKVLKLNLLLKKTSLDQIFAKPEKTTYRYLTDFGFSEKMISEFFQPFFSGIFLENKLETSSRMFEFVYKMFGEGNAALPKAGIEAIPQQLKNNLKDTTFLMNSKVKSVTDKEIFLEDGTILESHFTIIATEATPFLKEKPMQSKLWKSCDTLYFETEKRTIHQPLIGLIADTNTLINNVFYHTRLQSISVGSKELLSVTVVKNHGLDPENLQKQVENELQKHCGISSLRFLKHYAIPKALPQLNDLKYEINPKETQFSETIFLAGDVQLNGSLNAAMLAGERAALGVLNSVFQD
jgi:protoporphyrinogen oxidase